MAKKISVQIFGSWGAMVGSGGCGGCFSKSSTGSSSCSGCFSSKGCGGGCGSKTPKSMGQGYEELVRFVDSTSSKDFVNFEFLDINKINILDYDDIRYLYEEGYELPYCVIDGIVRYYGGISNELIYKDIMDIIED